MVCPLTKEHGLTARFTSIFTVEYTGLVATLDGKTIAEVYTAINNAFSHALNSPTYAATSAQNTPWSSLKAAASRFRCASACGHVIGRYGMSRIQMRQSYHRPTAHPPYHP